MTAIRFGTDGWRAVIADSFTHDNVARAAAATAQFFKKQTSNRRVLVGYDRRFLSEDFAKRACAVFVSNGWDAQLCERPLTTPALSVCVTSEQAAFGVMITASHNPALYNGFKIKETSGRSASPHITMGIESALASVPKSVPISATALNRFAFEKTYRRYLESRVSLKALNTLKGTIVLDHLYGVASGIAETMLQKSKCNVLAIHSIWDPLFGGLHPEPIEAYLGDLKKTVKKNKALIGLAFDGDADRLGAVDDKGQYMPPHHIFPLLALYGLQHKKWKGKIVQSVSMGVLGERIAKHFGVAYEEVPVGFKHIADQMVKEPVAAGGEESGGFGFSGGLPERDGILSGLMLLEMISVLKEKPSLLVQRMEKQFGAVRFMRTDYRLQSMPYSKDDFTARIQNVLPSSWNSHAIQKVKTFDGIKIHLDDDSWLLMRPSGTEPLLRTYAESPSTAQTKKLLGWAKELLTNIQLAVEQSS